MFEHFPGDLYCNPLCGPRSPPGILGTMTLKFHGSDGVLGLRRGPAFSGAIMTDNGIAMERIGVWGVETINLKIKGSSIIVKGGSPLRSQNGLRTYNPV